MKENSWIIHLFVKLQSQNITKEESKELEKWADKHPLHERLYQKMKKKDAYENWLKDLEEINAIKAWGNVQREIQKTDQKLFIRSFLKYAAGIIMLFGLGISGYYLLNQSAPQNQIGQVVQNEIKPGARMGELVLSDGRIVHLGEGSNQITEIDGTLIQNDSSLVSYRSIHTETSDQLVYNEVRVKQGEEFQLELSDGTKVWINSKSSVIFPVQFLGKTREVEITGEVYFEVTHDAKRPFIVHTPDIDVQVLGTKFNVSCYDDDHFIQATLASGKIKIVPADDDMEEVILAPDQQYEYNTTSGSVEVKKVDASIYTAWSEGYFQFEDQTLERIFIQLARWYNIDVSFLNPASKMEYFNGRLPRFENIDTILGMMEKVSNVKFDVNGNTIIIY